MAPVLLFHGVVPIVFVTKSTFVGTNDDEYAIAFRLIANANTGELRALVNGFNFPENYDITFPLIGNELKDGLAKAYVEEATSNETKAMLQKTLVQDQSVMFESDQNIEG